MNIVELHFYDSNFDTRYPDSVEVIPAGKNVNTINETLFSLVLQNCTDNDFHVDVIRDGKEHSGEDDHLITYNDDYDEPRYMIEPLVDNAQPNKPVAKVITEAECIYWYLVS